MRGSVQCYFILSQLARFCKKNLRKFADDGGGDCDARRRPSRRKIALPRARSISRSIGAAPQPHRSPPQELCKFRRFPLARSGIRELHCLPHVRRGFEYVRHAAEFMKFRCPAYARRRIYSARGAYRAGDGVFSEFTNRITLLKQRNSGLKPPRYCPRGILGRQSGIMRFRSGYASAAFSEPGIFRSRFIRTAAAAHTRNSVTGNAIHIPEICRVRFSSHIKGKSRIP